MRRPRHREMRSFVFCVAWRAFPSPLSKLHRRLDSLYATQWAPRNTRRDSRGKQNPLLPLETRPDSQMSLECNPEIPVAPVEEHYFLDRSLDEVSFALQLLESISTSHSQLNGRLVFPGPTQEEARIPGHNARIPPKLEKNHVIPPSSQDEVLARYSISKQVPCSD